MSSILKVDRIQSDTGTVNVASNIAASNLTINGVASFAAGTAALPSIAGATDPNTGIFFSAANTVDIATDGVARAQVNSAGDFAINAGFGSVGKAYLCRAWVNFNGTTNVGGNCTIRASGNVSTVADNGTGDYTVNFTTAMPDANYSVGSAPFINSGNISITYVTLYSTTSFTVANRNGFSPNIDNANVFLQVFR